MLGDNETSAVGRTRCVLSAPWPVRQPRNGFEEKRGTGTAPPAEDLGCRTFRRAWRRPVTWFVESVSDFIGRRKPADRAVPGCGQPTDDATPMTRTLVSVPAAAAPLPHFERRCQPSEGQDRGHIPHIVAPPRSRGAGERKGLGPACSQQPRPSQFAAGRWRSKPRLSGSTLATDQTIMSGEEDLPRLPCVPASDGLSPPSRHVSSSTAENALNLDLLHALNSFVATRDAVEDPVAFYVQASELLFASLVVAVFLFGGRRGARGAVAALAAAALALLAAQGAVACRGRAAAVRGAPHLVRALVAHASDASFPSDHATAAFAIATAIWLRRRTVECSRACTCRGAVGGSRRRWRALPGRRPCGAVLGVSAAVALWSPPLRRVTDGVADRPVRRPQISGRCASEAADVRRARAAIERPGACHATRPDLDARRPRGVRQGGRNGQRPSF
jgi:undecaprenyl-diphosphatase